MKTSRKRLYPCLAIILGAAIFVVLSQEQATHPETSSDPQNPRQSKIPASPRTHDAALESTATETQHEAPPATIRGPNNSLQYAAPVLTEVSADAHAKAPVTLANTPADGRDFLLPEEIDSHTLVSRRMDFNRAGLDQIISGQRGRILAPLPDGSEVELRIDTIKRRGDTTHSLLGRIEGKDATSDVLLVSHNGIIHGSIAEYESDRHIEYRVLSSGHLMVRELDGSTMTERCGHPGDTPADAPHHSEAEAPAEDTATPPPGNAPVASEEPAADTPNYTTIDVVVGYGTQARITDGGVPQIEARIIASVDRMNTTFVNSLIANTELMLLGTIEDPDYVFPGNVAGIMNSGDELGDLDATSDGALDTVSDYASALGADFKSFVIKDVDGYAGVAYRPGSSSIVARNHMTSYSLTFVHELGHNIGCRHSWGDDNVTSVSTTEHNYGWRLKTASGQQYRTVMSYDWNWTRIPYFSNPDVEYLGARTGQADGYDATGDDESDPRYISGGRIGTLGAGFDGSNPSLGARNADYIQDNVSTAANRTTRQDLAVVTPSGSATWAQGSTYNIYWTGGDYTDSAAIDLYKGGSYQYTIANGFTAENRNYQWAIPSSQAPGSDYSVRITLNGSLFDNSSSFTIRIATPTNLQATTAGAETIDLTWNDHSGSETVYEVQRASSGSGPWTTLAPLPANSTSYSDTGRTPDTLYYYQVNASDGTYDSPSSTTASATTWSLGEAWRNQYFGSIDNSGNAADAFDYDQDGLVNRLERAFGTHPADSSDTYCPTESILNIANNDYLAITYRRLKGGTGTTGVDYSADGLTYTVEANTDLTETWSNGLNVVEEVIPPEGRPDNGNGTEEVTVRSKDTLTTSEQQFLKLSIQTSE